MNYLAKKSVIKGLITPSNVAEILKKVSKAGRTKLVKWIVDNWSVHNINDCFVTAAKAGRLKVVHVLHANGADIRADNDYAIRWASYHGDLNMVRFLHANGADIRTQNDYAIIWASYHGHFHVAQFLHANGADIRASNDFAIRWASRNGHLNVVQFLHANGADIRIYNDWAIRWASESGHLDVVKFLHANGADIFAVENYHKNIEPYITTKKWLHTNVSELKKQAAKVFVANYDALPEADTIPEEILQILTAAKI